MSFFAWLRRWFSPAPRPKSSSTAAATATQAPPQTRRKRLRARLVPFRHDLKHPRAARRKIAADAVEERPYTFARPSVFGGYLDLSRDHNPAALKRFGLPALTTPQELADWLEIPLGRLAWLVHRFEEKNRPTIEQRAHYHYQWIDKRKGGQRLIEIPKPTLKAAQHKILRDILDHVPPHPSAHGFIRERSIRSNALPHVGQRVLVKSDLRNFYPAVSFPRVVAIFRRLGYSREVAIWLGRLTTSTLPESMRREADVQPWIRPYLPRHLPQGAPTSPALANLSAFSLDLRLSGLARRFHARYTRYADDLTFSGGERFLGTLRTFLPLVSQIVRAERFKVHRAKSRVVRNNQRQQVTGVVVNACPNISRADYDRLKATLVNCVRRGPSTQNHTRHDDFAACLRGRIAHVAHIHPIRGEKLLALYDQIDWNT